MNPDEIVNFKCSGVVMSMSEEQKRIFDDLPRKQQRDKAMNLRRALKKRELVQVKVNGKVAYVPYSVYKSSGTKPDQEIEVQTAFIPVKDY